jgi:hypothetical protein
MVFLLDKFSVSQYALKSGWEIEHDDYLHYIQRISPTLHFCKNEDSIIYLFIYLFIYLGVTRV